MKIIWTMSVTDYLGLIIAGVISALAGLYILIIVTKDKRRRRMRRKQQK